MANGIVLNIDTTKSEFQNPMVQLRQGDGNYQSLSVTVTSNGEPFDLTDWTIMFMGTTAGGFKIVDAASVVTDAVQGEFTYTPTKAWGQDEGEFKNAYFKFTKADETASGASFRVNVLDEVDLTAEEAGNYISVVDVMIGQVKTDMETKLAETKQMLTDTQTQANTVQTNVNDLNTNVTDLKAQNNNIKTSDNTWTGNNTFTQQINGMFATKSVDETDYNDVAKNMYKYSGIGIISGTPLENSPTDGATWYLIQTMPGGGNDSGYIQAYIRGITYGTGVNQGEIQGWTELADNSKVLHNTGNETVAGNKTFTDTIVGSITGNAGSATKLQTSRKINGTPFDGTSDITITGSGALAVGGIYPTLSDLISSDPDHNRTYITTDNGNWNYWNGTAWVSGGIYQSAGIADKSVTPPKTNFISKNTKNINLFDKDDPDNWFGKVVNTTGDIQTLSDWNYSHSIPCKPGDTFIVGTTSATSYGYAGLFNGEQWVSNVTNTNGYWQVPTDFSGTSIRFAISASMFETTMIVLMPNELPNVYTPFNFLLDDQIKLDYANLENVSVEENDVTFISKNQGTNKFDLNNTQPKIINADKVNTTLDGYVSTNDIQVKTGDVVNWNFSGYGWVLDSQKNPIEYMPSPDLYKNSYTISNANASFVRIAIATGDVSKGMVTINEPIPTDYQYFHSFYKLANNIMISDYNIIKSQTNETQNPISGKTISIIGDSYSAFAGWMPEGNNISYNGTYNGVTSVSDMWWYKIIQKFNMSLMLNESWAGSTICNTGYGASDATETSFLTRITKRYGATNTLGQKPQVLFVLGGLNDTWANSPLGNAKYSDWTTDDLKTVLGAYSKMINDILLYNPGIEIINFEYAAVSQEIRDGKALICEHFGVKNVPISAVDSSEGHPTTTGMQQIVDQIITAFNI